MGCLESRQSSSTLRHKNFHDIYQLGAKLGEGNFGQVHEAKERITGRSRAVKMVDARIRDEAAPVEDGLDQALARSAANEIYLWERIGEHRNCVRLMEAFLEGGHFYMVMEQYRGTVMHMLMHRKAMTESAARKYFHGMLAGVTHLHSLAIAHRDVKPDNFLMSGDGDVKLCDFGMAAFARWGALHGICGTSPYMAPEMLQNARYDEAVDVWSLGASFFLMLFGEFPYMPPVMSPQEMKKAIRQNSPKLDVSQARAFSSKFLGRLLPVSAMDLVRQLLERRPSKRVKAANALQHYFLQMPATPRAPAGGHKPAREMNMDEPFHSSRAPMLDVLRTPCTELGADE